MKPTFLSEIHLSQRTREPGMLIGVRNICAYVQIGPQTFYKLHAHHDFPAMRLPDGRWCTSKSLIDRWVVSRWKAQKAQHDPRSPMFQSAGEESMESVA